MNIFENFNVTDFEGKLKNGIKVVLFYRPGSPIYTSVILNSGSKYDPEKMYGLAHFLEHMIVNGSQDFPSKYLLTEHIESVGGAYEAGTTQEYIRINTEVSDKSDYSRVVDIFNATLCKPLMDKAVFENEKQVVVKEIKMRDSNPSQIIWKIAKKLFFIDTSFEHDIMGYEESVLKLKYEESITEYKKLFDKSRITFVTSGDISIDELINYLNKLSFLEGNNFIPNEEKLIMQDEKKILSSFFDAPQTHIYFGVHGPKLYTKESLHLDLLGQIIAGGRASRLIKRLRYNKGLVYSVSFGKNGGINFGSWGISTNTSENKVQEVVNEMIKEIKDIQVNGIKESELEFVKNKRIKSLKRTMQTSEEWVDFHASPETFSKEIYNINTFVKDIEDTTVNDIIKVVDKYLGPEKWKLAMCGRTKEESMVIKW